MFQSAILSTHTVCSNCLARRRREVVQQTAWGEHKYYERNRDQLATEYVPDVPVTSARSVYCQCGVDSAFTRIWDDVQMLADRDRFRALVKQLIQTVGEISGVVMDAKRIAGHALAAFDRIPDPDVSGPFQKERPVTINDALEAGVEAGVTRVRSESPTKTHA